MEVKIKDAIKKNTVAYDETKLRRRNAWYQIIESPVKLTRIGDCYHEDTQMADEQCWQVPTLEMAIKRLEEYIDPSLRIIEKPRSLDTFEYNVYFIEAICVDEDWDFDCYLTPEGEYSDEWCEPIVTVDVLKDLYPSVYEQAKQDETNLHRYLDFEED